MSAPQFLRASLRLVVGSLFAVVSLTLFTQPVFAQSSGGSLTGTVRDEQNAAVAGAKITVVSNERKTRDAETQSNETGSYTVPSLIPGSYSVSVECTGFGSAQASPVLVEVGQRTRLDITLKVGDTTDAVSVTADTTGQIERDTSSAGLVITNEQIRQLPLFSRNPVNLIALAGGVSAGSATDGGLNTAQLSVNGSRTLNSEVTIDGVSAVVGSTGDVTFIPSVDALREFKVQAATYSAEFGRTSGATISATVSSGTSQYHGAVYEYFRNEALNANNFFNNSRGIARPQDRYNQFGASLGGPIPFTRKNTFFFFNYEGLRRTIPRQYTSTVPTADLRVGDLSAFSTVIRDPATGQQVRDPSRATAANPMGLNIIPLNRINPAAAAIIASLPTANQPGALNNFVTISPDRVSLNQFNGRVDHNLGSAIRLFGRYSQQTGSDANFTTDASTILPGPLNPGTSPNQPIDRQMALGYTHTFSPSVVNEFLFGFNRNVQAIDPPGAIDSPTTLGFQNLPQLSLGGGSGFFAPTILFGNFNYGFRVGNTGRFGANSNTLRRQTTNTFQVGDSVSLLFGKHTIKTGVQFRRNQLNIFNGGAQFSGNYTINGDNLPGAPANNPATQWAAFLFGLVDSAVYQIPQPPTGRRNFNLGFFIQDDWKVTPRLTLNLGLRWDYESPLTMSNGIYSRVDVTTGRLLVAGLNATDTLNLEGDRNNFGPRVGFAYALNDKTVIRGAYGLFYSQIFSNLGGSGALYPGFTTTQQFLRRGPGQSQAFSLSQGIPLTTFNGVTDPLAVERNASPSNPLQPSAQFGVISPLPSIHQWSLGVQRVLPFNITVDVSYIGTRSIHLPLDARDFNSVPLERFEEVARGGTAGATQNARPFPNVATLNAFENVGNSIYHSGQIKVVRRFAKGFGLSANYTFSKSIDDGSGIFNFSQPNGLDRGLIPTFRRDLDRSVSAFDRPHSFTGAAQYELPFGTGKPFLSAPDSTLGKIAKAIFGDFQINTLISARSGLPDTITISGISTLSQSQPRPSVIPGAQFVTGISAGPNGTVRYFQAPGTTGFAFTPVGPLYVGSGTGRTQVLPFTLGTLGRNTLRGPGYFNVDLSIIRRFRITERLRFDFRVEAFNLFNTVNYLFDPAGSTTNLPVQVVNNQAVFVAPTFGLIDRAFPARRLQIVGRIEF